MVIEKVIDWKVKMTFISKIGASVIDYILYSHNIGSFMKTHQIKDSIINDYNIVEAVVERRNDTNGREGGKRLEVRESIMTN
jgi:hypothetical protein